MLRKRKKAVSLVLMAFLLLLPSTMSFAQVCGDVDCSETIEENIIHQVKSDNNINNSLCFTENKGQWSKEILFLYNDGQMSAWFTKEGVYYQYNKIINVQNYKMDHMKQNIIEKLLLKSTFVNSNNVPNIIGRKINTYKCNYFFGDEPQRWYRNVSNYDTIVYEGIYSGIDLKYFNNDRNLEYEFIVYPGSNPAQIKILYEGIDSLLLNESGCIEVVTKWNRIIEQKPFVYQEHNGNRITISADYEITSRNTFTFKIKDNYDKSLALIIDPTLIYSTYLGGSKYDAGLAITVDSSLNYYICGETNSSDFPLLHPFDSIQNGFSDIFITKFNSSGDSILYSTFIGGYGSEYGLSIKVSKDGTIFLTGTTTSLNFPIINAYDSSLNGTYDAFILKLDSTGDSIIFSSYIGGNGDEEAKSIFVDKENNIYIAGWSSSYDFPVFNAYQAIKSSGVDCFVTKINSDGDSLIYSTFIGGTGADHALCLVVDNEGHTYVSGNTTSDDFPVKNAYQSTFGGAEDCFIFKLSSMGDALLFSTYLGGSAIDEGAQGIDIDSNNNIYITGRTYSFDFPIINAYQSSKKGNYDLFVSKFSNLCDSLIYSTYLGGSDEEKGGVLVLDYYKKGNVYIVGSTGSIDYPLKYAYDSSNNGTDIVITILNNIGDVKYSSYLGGTDSDHGWNITVNRNNYIYITGRTNSTDYPTMYAYDNNYNNTYDVFISIFDCCILNSGNVDCSDDEEPDITDITRIIDYLYLSHLPLCCPEEADVNGSTGEPDISDINYLIQYLYNNGPELVECQ